MERYIDRYIHKVSPNAFEALKLCSIITHNPCSVQTSKQYRVEQCESGDDLPFILFVLYWFCEVFFTQSEKSTHHWIVIYVLGPQPESDVFCTYLGNHLIRSTGVKINPCGALRQYTCLWHRPVSDAPLETTRTKTYSIQSKRKNLPSLEDVWRCQCLKSEFDKHWRTCT